MKRRNGVEKALVMFVQVTITMLSPLLICGALGVWLNDKFQTSFWFLGMMFLGIVAAFRNFYHLVRGFYEKDLKEETERQQYFDSMKQQRDAQTRERQKKS